MSIENIEAIEHVAEEETKFEKLEYTQDLGVQTAGEVKKILKDDRENFELWRLPTTAEFFALYKKHKKSFFAHKSYWAANNTDNSLLHELCEFRIGMMGPGWSFETQNSTDNRVLVLIKNGTHIDGVEEQIEKIKEEYPF